MKNKILFILTFLTILFIGITQTRHFYHFRNGSSLTLWKTMGGRCYIVPGYYLSPFRPDKNYIATSNLSLIHVVIDKAAKFDFILSSSLDYSFPTKIDLPDFSIKHYPSSEFNEFSQIYLSDTIPKKEIEHLSVDIKEMTAVLNGEVQ